MSDMVKIYPIKKRCDCGGSDGHYMIMISPVTMTSGDFYERYELSAPIYQFEGFTDTGITFGVEKSSGIWDFNDVASILFDQIVGSRSIEPPREGAGAQQRTFHDHHVQNESTLRASGFKPVGGMPGKRAAPSVPDDEKLERLVKRHTGDVRQFPHAETQSVAQSFTNSIQVLHNLKTKLLKYYYGLLMIQRYLSVYHFEINLLYGQ